MSDSEKKTEEKVESKAVDTAPSIKKYSQQVNTSNSSKGNAVIQMVLLLVVAIVITATFYEDEFKDLVAQKDPATAAQEEVSSTDDTAVTEAATVEPVSKDQLEEQQAESQTASTEASSATTSANQSAPASITNQPATGLIEKTSTINPATTEAAGTASDQTSSQTRDAQQKRRPFVSRQDYERAREEAMARAGEQAKKHNEFMQQRRQAYEKEMQERREKYEAAMKEYMEKRAKIAEAQKAIYQQFEQNRVESMQKMEELHKEIAEMHKQMHLMMRESRPQMKRDPRSPMTRHPRPQFRYNSATPEQETQTKHQHAI